MTETQAAASVRSAIESWQFGKDHGLIMWRKINDPMHAVERGRDILTKVYLGNLAESVLAKVQDEESEVELLNAAEAITKSVEQKLLAGAFFDDVAGNPFKRATAEIKCKASAAFVSRMRRVLNGEEANGA